METNPYALYCRLLEDLSHYLTYDQYWSLVRGGEINCDATLEQYKAFSLGKSFLKKFEVANTKELDRVALEKFLDANRRSGAWCPQPSEVWHQELIGLFSQEIYNFWYTGPGKLEPLASTDDDVLKFLKTGPGSAVGARGEDFYTKLFDSPLSCSRPSLYHSYRRYVSQFPSWQRAEEARSALWGEANVVKGSRLTFVPKNDATSRTICVEPNLNVLFQLGFGAILTERLKQVYGIDLSSQQEKNRILARRGSRRMGRGPYGTLDLESASDTISANMLWHYFPKTFLGFLERYRCDETEIPGRGRVTLGMISSMGNGYTFPLQTVIFSAVVVAAYRQLGIKLRLPRGSGTGNFGVNGDDIVIRRNAWSRVVFLLGYLGFKVNSSKSFVEGPFRESCGGDYFNGRSVRGVYIKRLDTEQARYVAINRLVQFTFRTGIVVPRTIRWLLARVTWRPVPWGEDDAAGVKTSRRRSKGWSARYQCPTYRALRPPRFGMTIDDGRIFSPKRAKRRNYNPDGLLVSIVHGSVRASFIPLRQERVEWREVRRPIPSSNWEWAPAPGINCENSWAGAKPQDIRLALLIYGLD